MGVGFFLIAIRASADNLWRPLEWGFEDLLASAGSGSTLMAIQFFLLGDLLPDILAMLPFGLVAFAFPFVGAFISTLIVPFRYQAHLAGMDAIAA